MSEGRRATTPFVVSDLSINPQRKPLRGHVPVPSDKSITHRALIFGALARGRSRVVTSAMGGDNQSTLACLRALGVVIEHVGSEIRIDGVGLMGLRAPESDLDCGNSGTSMRLLAGLLSAQRFQSRLVGDASLSARPMSRITKPLRQRGARIEGRLSAERVGQELAPLSVGPLPEPHVLSEIDVALEIPSAQVKSALLISGLYAAGDTRISEPLLSRDHTERMLSALGVPLQTSGSRVALVPRQFGGELDAFELAVPGDLSAAAFVLAAAAMVPGSEVSVARVGTNPTRGGFMDALRMMGADLGTQPLGDELGEPLAHLACHHRALSGIPVGGELVLRAIDEIPVLCALAATAQGTTRITDAHELRVKESDRLAAMARVLRAFGVTVEELADGLVIEGRSGAPLAPATVSAEGDHRVAMSAALLGLVASGPSRVLGVDAIATSFPRFVATLRALGAELEVV